jgi:predicted nucleic acid-binding protein
MTGRIFVDTNLFIYAESDEQDKAGIAVEIIQANPVISTQVINETVSTLTRKYEFLLSEAHEIAASMLNLCEVVPVDANTVRKAIELTRYYSLSHWDSLIVAAALLADCQTLYSEDMQHGQTIDGHLEIVNPFL